MAYLSRLYIRTQGHDRSAPSPLNNMLSTFLLTPYHYYMGYKGITMAQNPFIGYKADSKKDAFLPAGAEDVRFNGFQRSLLLLFSPILAPLSLLFGAIARYIEVRRDDTARHLYRNWDDNSAQLYLNQNIDIDSVWSSYAPGTPPQRFMDLPTPPATASLNVDQDPAVADINRRPSSNLR